VKASMRGSETGCSTAKISRHCAKSSPDRNAEAPLPHSKGRQLPALPFSGTRKHHADRPKPDHALTYHVGPRWGHTIARTGA
jgi:hypothetical protein